jgi:mono/diheme cytochrome c family protein
MYKWITFLGIVTIIWACSNASAHGDSATEAAEAAREAALAHQNPDGQKLYKQYCVTCHGLYGDMGASGAHDLTASALTVEERIEVITNGRNAMTPFKSLLRPEQIEAIAAYTLELKRDEE